MPKPARVLGPYRNADKWRLVLLDGPSRKALLAETYEAALALRAELSGALKQGPVRSISDALAEYMEGLGARGVGRDTLDKVQRMLRSFLPLEEPLAAIDPERALRMYLAETKRLKSDGKPIANDSHHLLLRRLKHFYKWAVAARYIPSSPFAEVRPIGRPRRGKPQLRIDEARRFVSAALIKARALDVGATAALLQIFLGLRPTEAMVRVVRDLDDGGRVLWIPSGKTQGARRRLQVPETLREVLLLHASGKDPESPLLGPPGEPLHTRDALRHRLKQLCDQLGLPRVCPHSLRGLNATLALDAGATPHHVAAALGHASFVTTARHYADVSSVANAGLRRVADLLGRKDADGTDIGQLAGFLREHLSAEEIQLLRQRLAADS